MIQTFTFKPSGLLKNHVSYFAVREFDCYDEDLFKPMTAKHEIHMMFMINCHMHNFTNHQDNPYLYKFNKSVDPECVYSGLLTSNKGTITFRDHVKLLTIHFKPTGFYAVFGISPAEITNCLANSSDLFGNQILLLHEQLQTAKTTLEILNLTENFLMDRLWSRSIKKYKLSLFKVSEFLVNQTDFCSIEKLAYESNMSLKTFERKFIEEIGLAPKLYERVRRFDKALDIKMNHPSLSWTNICYLSGYYDQNHLIKDFIKFAGEPPLAFFRNSPPPPEQVSSSS